MMRSSFILGLTISATLSQSALAFRGGPPSGRTGGPANGGQTCRSCHGNTVGTGSVEILGTPDNYQANAVYDLTVRVSDSVKVGAGFQISVEDGSGNHIGTLSLIDNVNTQLNTAFYVDHTFDGVADSVTDWAANGNSASYPVRWTAPATDMGTVTFWAAGNAINNNFSSTGDFVYLTSKSAGFASVPAVSTWGMVVLALCLMTCATVVTIHRKAALVPVRAG